MRRHAKIFNMEGPKDLEIEIENLVNGPGINIISVSVSYSRDGYGDPRYVALVVYEQLQC